MHELVNWLLMTIGTLGYPGIFLLMAMESSVIPVPSELVMPPAGYLAQQGQMNIWASPSSAGPPGAWWAPTRTTMRPTISAGRCC